MSLLVVSLPRFVCLSGDISREVLIPAPVVESGSHGGPRCGAGACSVGIAFAG